VAEVEFLIAAQAPMPTAVLWQVDFITPWVTMVVAELFVINVVQVDGVLRPMAEISTVQVDSVV
jgi:hypothetical protein